LKDKGLITLKYLQEYIRSKDFHPDRKKDYFLKQSKEVGELARAIRKDLRPVSGDQAKETLE